MIVTATAPDRWEFLSLGPRTQARFEAELHALNTATRAVASLYGAEVLDVAGHPGLSRQENFAGDGLHPSHLGHRRAADGFKALVADRYPTRLREESLR
jgi:lysophospholipase L1-like esterase